MMLVWAMAYVVVIVGIGAAITCALLQRQRRSITELAGLVLTLGAGTCGMLLLWSSMLGIRPNRLLVLCFVLAALALLITLANLRRLPFLRLPAWDRRPSSLLAIIPIAVLLLANLSILIPAVGFDIFEWDAFSIWALKAKVLYESPLTPRPSYFTDVRLTFSHLDYPLLAPMLTAGSYAMMGQIDDRLGKIVLPLILAGQTLLAYSAARLWLGRLAALMATVIFVCTPLNLAFAGLGVADVTLATFWLGSVAYLIRWIENRLRRDLIMMGIFAVFTAMTKSEGMPLAVVLLIILWVRSMKSRTWKDAAIVSAIIVVGISIWLIWRIGIPRTDENYLGRLRPSILLTNVDRLPTILSAIFSSFVQIDRWGAIWMLLPLMAALGYRAFTDQRAIVLWAILVVHLMLYTLAYVIAPWEDLAGLIKASLERLLIHVAPAAMLLLAAHWAGIDRAGTDVPG